MPFGRDPRSGLIRRHHLLKDNLQNAVKWAVRKAELTKPGQVIVHFGTNPDNELRNGKPAWAIGVNIYRKLAGETTFTLIAMDTSSPYTDHLPPGTVVTYKLAYRGIRETDICPMAPEETVTVGG